MPHAAPSSPPPDSKHTLRRRLMSARAALAPAFQAEAAAALCGHIITGVDIQAGACIAGYWPMRGEISVLPLLLALIGKGCAAALPRTQGRDAALTFLRWTPDTPLLRSVFAGLCAPDPACASETTPAIVLVPLLGFDAAGHRLGYGAGHYDRTFAHWPAGAALPLKIGVGYDMQRLERLPAEAHDIKLDMICTESGLHRPKT